MKRIRCIVFIRIFFCLCSGYAQHIELGAGGIGANFKYDGLNIHSFAGYNFGKNFTLGLKNDYNILSNQRDFYSVFVYNRNSSNPFAKNDTFHNVHQETKHAIYCLSIDPRFYGGSKNLRTFICPSFGFGVFREKTTLNGDDYYQLNVDKILRFSYGLEAGMEIPLGKKSPLAIQTAISLRKYIGLGYLYDAYSSPFLYDKLLLFTGRLSIVLNLEKIKSK